MSLEVTLFRHVHQFVNQ